MKRSVAILLSVALAIAVASCGRRGDPIDPNDVPPPAPETSADGKTVPAPPPPPKQPTTMFQSFPLDFIVGK